MPSAADSPTFFRDVLPILQENCQVCHRPGGANMGGMIAPMAFTTYEETRPWAKAIAQQTAARTMPPWGASSAQHGLFKGERSLTAGQIDTIARWVAGGAPRGDSADTPAPLVWPDPGAWQIGVPDLVVEMPKRLFIEDDVEDLYLDQYSDVTDAMLPEERWVKAVEIRPGSPVVHHIAVNPLASIVPGNAVTTLPDGIGRRLTPGQTLHWELHYHKERGPGTGTWDRSQVAIRFYPKDAQIQYELQGNHLGKWDFVIPAGAKDYTLQAEYFFKHDSRIVQFWPHMHYRGKSAKYEAFYPDGTSEILLEVPRYDFNWQTTYQYKEFKAVPAGTKVVFTSAFDNSAENPLNPNPAVNVPWGHESSEEMSLGKMAFINDSGTFEPMFGPDSGSRVNRRKPNVSP